MVDESDDREAADAAKAFEDLQAEVALQRRAVEAMGDALEAHQAPDMSTDIARILKGQAQVLERVEALQKHSALQLTPAQHGQAMAQAVVGVGGVVREAVQQLQRATQEVERERAQLASLVGAAKARGQQKQVLAWTAGAALVVGLLLSPLLVRSLPVGLSSHVAAFLVKENRWNAGSTLMQVASPDQWPEIVEAARLAKANKESLAVCREAAAKSRRDQRCSITVPAP
jgi:hypothetical protein